MAGEPERDRKPSQCERRAHPARPGASMGLGNRRSPDTQVGRIP